MSEPVRLHKRDDTSLLVKYWQNMEAWLLSHSSIILLVLFLILIILIIGLCGAIMDVFALNGTITGTEANGYYYHLEDII